MAKLSPGDEFPELRLAGPDGTMALSDLWHERPLVVAFERHFG